MQPRTIEANGIIQILYNGYEDSDFTSGFWGILDPDVARRALSMEYER